MSLSIAARLRMSVSTSIMARATGLLNPGASGTVPATIALAIAGSIGDAYFIDTANSSQFGGVADGGAVTTINSNGALTATGEGGLTWDASKGLFASNGTAGTRIVLGTTGNLTIYDLYMVVDIGADDNGALHSFGASAYAGLYDDAGTSTIISDVTFAGTPIYINGVLFTGSTRDDFHTALAGGKKVVSMRGMDVTAFDLAYRIGALDAGSWPVGGHYGDIVVVDAQNDAIADAIEAELGTRHNIVELVSDPIDAAVVSSINDAADFTATAPETFGSPADGGTTTSWTSRIASNMSISFPNPVTYDEASASLSTLTAVHEISGQSTLGTMDIYVVATTNDTGDLLFLDDGGLSKYVGWMNSASGSAGTSGVTVASLMTNLDKTPALPATRAQISAAWADGKKKVMVARGVNMNSASFLDGFRIFSYQTGGTVLDVYSIVIVDAQSDAGANAIIQQLRARHFTPDMNPNTIAWFDVADPASQTLSGSTITAVANKITGSSVTMTGGNITNDGLLNGLPAADTVNKNINIDGLPTTGIANLFIRSKLKGSSTWMTFMTERLGSATSSTTQIPRARANTTILDKLLINNLSVNFGVAAPALLFGNENAEVVSNLQDNLDRMNSGSLVAALGIDVATYSLAGLRLGGNEGNNGITKGWSDTRGLIVVQGEMTSEEIKEMQAWCAKDDGWTYTDTGPVDTTVIYGDPNAFIMSVETTAASETFTLPLLGTGYDFTVDWGDGTSDAITSDVDPALVHTYGSAGTHTIKVTGTFPRIRFNNAGDRQKVRTVEQLGNVGWTTFQDSFYGCNYITKFHVGAGFTQTATSTLRMLMGVGNLTSGTPPTDFDLTNLVNSGVTTISDIMFGTSKFDTVDLSSWDTSGVTDCADAFRNIGAKNIIGMSSWVITGLDGASDLIRFLSGSSIPTAEYDALLIAWDAQSPVVAQTSADFGTSTYTGGGAAATARASLVGKGWVITDGGVAA